MSTWARRALCLAIGLFCATASAHVFEFTEASATFATDGSYVVEIILDIDALALGVSAETDSTEVVAALSALSPAEFEQAAERARRTIERRLRVRFDDTMHLPKIHFPERDRAQGEFPSILGTKVRMEGQVPAGATMFTFRASRAFPPVQLTLQDETTATLVRYPLGPGEDSLPFELGSPDAGPGRADIAGRYFALGFQHILPLGLDHILFVVGLFLLGHRLGPLLWQVTAFTVAHTATLALSIYGVVSWEGRWVETLIALSIAYVAIENLVTEELKPWRPLLVFCFGLLHGLGFAGVLRELGLPRDEATTGLIAFNVGVEGGQLAVIAMAFLAVGWFRRRSWYRRRIVLPVSTAIAVIGLYWAIERALL